MTSIIIADNTVVSGDLENTGTAVVIIFLAHVRAEMERPTESPVLSTQVREKSSALKV
jgi:hypothetical protein